MHNRFCSRGYVAVFLLVVWCLTVGADSDSTVKIAFDDSSKRIEIVTGNELPDYTHVQRGSFQFFTGRLDEPENTVRYFHDGARSVKIENLAMMEKFSKMHAQWRLTYSSGRRPSPQYIPRVHSLAVSFVPIESDGEAGRRVYVLMDDLKLIDWRKAQ